MEKSIKEIKVLSGSHWIEVKNNLLEKGYVWRGGIPINDYPILEKTDFPFYITFWKDKSVTWCYAGMVEAARAGNIIKVKDFNEIFEYQNKSLSY